MKKTRKFIGWLSLFCLCFLLTTFRAEANSILTAKSVSANATVGGIPTSKEPVYYYKVVIPSDGYLTIQNLTSNMSRLGLAIYGSKGQMLAYKTIYNQGTQSYRYTISAGTYYLRLIGNYGNATSAYCYGTYSFSLKYVKKSTATDSGRTGTITVSSISVKTYTGKRIRPTITVKDGTYTMVQGVDYTLTYKNNKYPGKATITINGIGSYQGKKTVSFFIKPKKGKILSAQNLSGMRVSLKWKKAAKVTGYQIYYSTQRSSGYKLIGKDMDTTMLLGFKAKKTYYFRVRSYKEVDGVTLYGSLSAPKKVIITQ